MRKLIAVGLLAVSVVSVAPAEASGPVAFRMSLQLSLPTYPCTAGACNGTYTGTVQGQLDGSGGIETSLFSGALVYHDQAGSFCLAGNGAIGGLEYTRAGPLLLISGEWQSHGVAGSGTWITTPAVPPGCLPGGAPGPVTVTIQAAIAGA